MDFTDKTIWITGASSGIGKAVAIKLSKENTNLILSDINEKGLVEVADICKNNSCTTQIIPIDLSDEKAVEAAVRQVFDKQIKIDCLYQFAGISQRSLVSETPLFVDRKIFEINFFGAIALTKAILPKMIKNGGGQIAVTSSLVGKFGFPYRSSYSATKHALHGFFESLRAENKQNNIRVSIIIPGRVRTNISLNALDKDGKTHAKMDAGQDTGITADKAATIICRNLKKNKKEILVGGKELMMVHIRRFLPRLYYYMSTRIKPM
ncbi:MAG: SDR family NAD(P)-dependent oxidoreductase [Draconibacterium sp.]|nr:SDR family NAD(P)-dependent oxidoreductase [Draconibacterium sp.]